MNSDSSKPLSSLNSNLSTEPNRASPIKVLRSTKSISSDDDDDDDASHSDADDWLDIPNVNALESASQSLVSLEPSGRDISRVKRILSHTRTSTANTASNRKSNRKRRTGRPSNQSSDDLSSDEEDSSDTSSQSPPSKKSKSKSNSKTPSNAPQNPATTPGSRAASGTGGIELVVQIRKGIAAERKRRVAIHQTHLLLLTQHMIHVSRALVQFANEQRAQLLLLTGRSVSVQVPLPVSVCFYSPLLYSM